MKIFAETDRLILREILQSYLDGMFELDSEPEVHKYLGGKKVSDKNQIEKVIDFVRQQYTDHGIGRWAVIDKRTNAFIGWTGLKFITELTNGHKNYYDLGYR
jgi:ribosomal-protein-alanine N-acetyltransferase